LRRRSNPCRTSQSVEQNARESRLNANFGKAQLERRFASQTVHQGVWVGDADAAIAELRSADGSRDQNEQDGDTER
jgi:hypothetical protein